VCTRKGLEKKGFEKKSYKNGGFHNHCWHLDHIVGTQNKITICCQCSAKKVSEVAKKEKTDYIEP
jgi:hypothetical protein